MTKLVAAIAFIVGLVLGIGVNILLNLIFWFAIGTALVVIVDAAAGLSQPVCDFRVRVSNWLAGLWRRPKPEPVANRKTVWVNITEPEQRPLSKVERHIGQTTDIGFLQQMLMAMASEIGKTQANLRRTPKGSSDYFARQIKELHRTYDLILDRLAVLENRKAGVVH
jgi:hypothetical protein